MIVYFSATGNCEYVANQIANATCDKAVSILKLKNHIELKQNEALGFVFPTYFWGLPSICEEFLTNLTIDNAKGAYIYCVMTYGTTTGQADYFLNNFLKQKGLYLSASFSVKTVDNYTVLFSVKDERKNKAKLLEEQLQIVKIINSIKRYSKQFISKDKKTLWICKKARYFYDKARRTKHLHLLVDKCISCGQCEKDCPTNTIKIINGKPTWQADKCAMCFRCLHRCPTFAIQYDKKTQKNGQYVHP